MKDSIKLNPYLFYLIKNGELVVWDYLHHRQFAIDSNYLEVLKKLSCDDHEISSKIKSEFYDAQLLGEYETPIWEWDDLSLIFHVGTSSLKNDFSLDEQNFSYDFIQESKNNLNTHYSQYREPSGEQINLLQPDFSLIDQAKLMDSLFRRQTSRAFTFEKIPLKYISLLLNLTFASQRRDHTEFNKLGIGIAGMRKTSPSGGGLHPTEAYFFAFNVEGLSPGIYHYSATMHRFTIIELGQFRESLSKICENQYFLSDLSAGIFLVSRFDTLWKKYQHSRAYRVALMDVGHVSQTLQLCATSLNLLTWLTGAFDDSAFEKLLKLEFCEKPLLFVGLGTGSPDSLDKVTKSLILENYDG